MDDRLRSEALKGLVGVVDSRSGPSHNARDPRVTLSPYSVNDKESAV